jgi:hypothetical protein
MTNAAALTFERDAPPVEGQQRRDHELWLAMQAAHDQWTIAAGVLDDLVAIASSDMDSPDVSLQIAKAAEEERSGFEAYIEARLAFSEFLLTRDSTTVNPEPKTTSKRTLLVVALVFPAFFALPYTMHERKQVRDLDAARAAIVALRNESRLQPPDRKLDAAALPSTPAQITPAVATTVQTPPVTGHWRRIGTPPPQPQKRAVRQSAPRKNIEFNLTPSARYAHLGSIRVSVQNVDQKRDCFDLSVMLGDFRLDRKHVRRYEPVWINLGGNSAPIRLIADRIGRNEVHGYLGIPAPKPGLSTSQRVKNAGSSTHGKSLAQSRTAPAERKLTATLTRQ